MVSKQRTSETSESPIYAATDVEVAIGSKPLLSFRDFSVEAGEVTGLIGHNGSGKSTLLKLLARQIRPSAGTVLYEGKPLDSWNERSFARSVAYLPQETPPAQGLLVGELVALGRYPWHGAFGRFSGADSSKTDQAVRLTDLVHLKDRLVETLSGGERQRAWLAMMVAQDARCLLLDEPISALDIAHQVEVLSLVQDLSRRKGLAVVLVLHDINMAARFCDRLVALKAGRLAADGTPQELLQPSLLRDIFGVEMSVIPHPYGKGPLAYVA